MDSRSVTVKTDGGKERIPARTRLWAAGVLVTGFAHVVAEATGTPMDRAGRLIVGPDLTLPGHPEIFVVGDAAVQPWKEDQAVPGVAQGAIQGGRYAGRAILRRLRGQPTPAFRYSNHGDAAVIGRAAGVTNIPWLGRLGQAGGFPAWVLWMGIHILYLIGFANRIVVAVRWAWSFVTHGRSSRLITGEPLLPPIEKPEPPA
jgi:NADH dehydrogenase